MLLLWVMVSLWAQPSQPILEPSKECAYLDAHCGICADNTCQGCSFPFQLNQSGKCGGSTPSPHMTQHVAALRSPSSCIPNMAPCNISNEHRLEDLAS